MIVEQTLFWAAVYLFIAAFLMLALSLIIKSKFLEKIARFSLLPGLAAQTEMMAVRWVAVGHPPMFGTFENALTTAWFILAIMQVFLIWKEISFGTSMIGVLMSLALFGWGLRFDTSRIPLTISERSLWVDIHAFLAMSAFALFAITISGSFRQAYLRISGKEENDLVDDLVMKNLLVGFAIFTLSVVVGAYYAFLLRGKWWQWDPVETTSIIAWLLFGLAIHLRLFYGWKRIKLGLVIALGFIVLVVAFWTILFFPDSYHIFDLEYVKHF